MKVTLHHAVLILIQAWLFVTALEFMTQDIQRYNLTLGINTLSIYQVQIIWSMKDLKANVFLCYLKIHLASTSG